MGKEINSNVRDPQNRSKKDCFCGCHGAKNSKPKRKRKPWMIRVVDATFDHGNVTVV